MPDDSPSGSKAEGRELPPESDLPSGISQSPYTKFIDITRKIVAAAMAICGVGTVVCVHRDDHLRLTLRQDSGMWGWGVLVFEIGVLVCLGLTCALVIEHLARPIAPARHFLRSLFIRFMLIVLAVAALCRAMVAGYGAVQGIGAVFGTLVLLAAVRAHRTARVILAIVAAILLGLTLLGTQSSYQYARWHAEEIVAAGRELMDRCPSTDYRPYNVHPEIDPSGTFALMGVEIQPGDPRVPEVLRKLGARRIWVDADRVAVYVGTNRFDFSTFPQPEIEFQIYRLPHPDTTENPVWGFRGKGSTKITDKLWTNLY